MPIDPSIEIRNSEEIDEIITKVPPWILRWGISLVFLLLLMIVGLSAWIRYPDIVQTGLKVHSLNAPKTLLAKMDGKLVGILVDNGDTVKENAPLAFMESTADHRDVMQLGDLLKSFNESVLKGEEPMLNIPKGLNLGELQGDFQSFHQEYLQYRATLDNGYLLKKRAFLHRDLKEIRQLENQIVQKQHIQQLEYENLDEKYKAYKKLYKGGVISKMEFQQQENAWLAAKYPLQQSKTAILNNNSAYAAKQKELLDINHSIKEQQAAFFQSLNKLINQVESWENKYMVRAPFKGQVSYAGILQENQNIRAGQELFVVNPGNSDFFGEIKIPQYNMGKVHKGQEVLVKLPSYPFEQFGMVRGRVSYVSNVAIRDSIFMARVDFEGFENPDGVQQIVLKSGMQGNAEIITQKSSLLQRFLRNITKLMNGRGA